MPNISIAPYKLSVTKRQVKKTDRLKLSKFIETEDSDLFEVIYECLENQAKIEPEEVGAEISEPEQSGKTFSIHGLSRDVTNRLIYGTIEIGEYGYEALIKNVKTRSLKHEKTIDEAEMIPLHFLISIPIDAKEGYVIFEHFGKYGASTEFRKIVMDCFRTQFPKYTLHVNKVIPEEVLQKYISLGKLKGISLIRFARPADKADARGPDGYQLHEARLLVSFEPPRNGSFSSLMKLLSGFLQGNPAIAPKQLTTSSVIGDTTIAEALGQLSFDQVQAEIAIDGKSKRVNLTDTSRLYALFDITDKVVTKGGHPTAESFRAEALALIQSLGVSTEMVEENGQQD